MIVCAPAGLMRGMGLRQSAGDDMFADKDHQKAPQIMLKGKAYQRVPFQPENREPGLAVHRLLGSDRGGRYSPTWV
jgi:hypothetical protein